MDGLDSLLPSLRFSENKLRYTDFGRSYTCKILQLPWKEDFANVLSAATPDTFLIGTEKGNVILFNYEKNQPVGIFRSDCWLSSVILNKYNVWSVGADKRVTSHHIISNYKSHEIKEDHQHDHYTESGIQFKSTLNKDFCLYNCGELKFKLLNMKTKKIVKEIDIARCLADDPVFKTFSKQEKTVRSFCVSTSNTQMYVVVNRCHPHLIVFDYKLLRLQQFLPLADKIDRQKQAPVGMHIVKTDADDILFFLSQVRCTKKSKVMSFYKVIYPSEGNKLTILAGTFPGKLIITQSTWSRSTLRS